MASAIIIFWSGRGAYVDRRPVGSFYPSFIKIIISAVRLRKKESGYVNYEQVNCRGGSSSPAHWLDAAKLSCGAQEVEDVKAIIRVIGFLLPAPLFWCLYGQKASTWVFQAKQMNGHVSWLGNIVIRPDQMQALDPLLVLVFVPLFDQVMYPFLEKHGVAMKAIKRLILGMLLASVAFFTSGLLQLAIDKRITRGSITSYNNTFSDSKPENKYHMGLFDIAYTNEKEKQISILWQVPQYVILAAAEVIFMVTGLEFSYSQAPVSMKSVVQAIWCLTSAEGDLITILVVGIIGNQLSTAKRSFLFAGVGIIGMVFMIWVSACYTDADNPNVEEDSMTVSTEVHSSMME